MQMPDCVIVEVCICAHVYINIYMHTQYAQALPQLGNFGCIWLHSLAMAVS